MSGEPCLPLVLKHDERHGTMTGYQNHQCRCDRCRAAFRAHREALITRGLTPGDDRHGTIYAYSMYRCRCEPCRAAKAESKARAKARRQEAA